VDNFGDVDHCSMPSVSETQRGDDEYGDPVTEGGVFSCECLFMLCCTLAFACTRFAALGRDARSGWWRMNLLNNCVFHKSSMTGEPATTSIVSVAKQETFTQNLMTKDEDIP